MTPPVTIESLNIFFQSPSSLKRIARREKNAKKCTIWNAPSPRSKLDHIAYCGSYAKKLESTKKNVNAATAMMRKTMRNIMRFSICTARKKLA